MDADEIRKHRAALQIKGSAAGDVDARHAALDFFRDHATEASGVLLAALDAARAQLRAAETRIDAGERELAQRLVYVSPGAEPSDADRQRATKLVAQARTASDAVEMVAQALAGERVAGAEFVERGRDVTEVTSTTNLAPCAWRLRVVAPALSAVYFGRPVYLVGGALTDPDPRDLDVVIELPDDLFVLAYGSDEAWKRPDEDTGLSGVGLAIGQWCRDTYAADPGPLWRRWARDCAKQSERLTRFCHRRVDFKVQPEAQWLALRDLPRLRLDGPAARAAGEGSDGT